MEWLSSNWVWAIIAAGALMLMFSGRGGCGMGHSRHSHDMEKDNRREDIGAPRTSDDKAAPNTALTAMQSNHDNGPRAAGSGRHHHACC